MQLLRLLSPKGLFTWIVFVIFCLGLVKTLGPRLENPTGAAAAGVVVAALVLLFWQLPSRWQEAWLSCPPICHGVVHGGLIYGIVVTLGFISQMRTPRNWIELLTLTGGAPWTDVHTVGAVGVGLAFMVMFGTKVVPAQPRVSGEILIRGPSLIPHTEADRMTRSHIPPNSACFFWGGVWLPQRCGTEHFCVVGESGGGKTKTIQMLLKTVLPGIKTGSNRRAVLYDAKRDLFSTLSSFGLSCAVRTLHPFDRRGVAWDIAADVTDPMIAIEIAHMLIPEKIGEHQPYFPNAARTLLSGVMECLLRQAPGKWTLRDAVLALRYPARVRALLEANPHTHYIREKYTGDTRTHNDIASTLENSMRRLAFVAAGWDQATEKISFERWLRDEESVLLLGSSPRLESTFRELNQAIVHRLSQLIREQGEAEREPSGRPPRQTWVVVDELREAGRMEGITKLLIEGRSKGTCVVLGFQDLPGLQAVYGKDLAAETIGLCANKAFLRNSDPTTQEFASKSFGTCEIDLSRRTFSQQETRTWSKDSSRSEGESVQHSYHRETKPLLLPSQFANDLPRPTRTEGLSGYYQTALVGKPYFARIPGRFIDELIGRVDYKNLPEAHADYLPRIGADGGMLTLREWDEADLERLNLKHRPELLETAKDRIGSLPDREESWNDLLSRDD